MQADILEGLQNSKLSYSGRSDSNFPLHALAGTALPSLSSGDRALTPHAAWEALLNTRLPFLLSESQSATSFLGLTKAAHSLPSRPYASLGVCRLHSWAASSAAQEHGHCLQTAFCIAAIAGL